jgi:hypothetical protein
MLLRCFCLPCRLSPQNTQHTTHTPNPTCAQRFRPITVERPKALLPLVNAPMIEYALEWLAMNRVEEVGLCFFVFFEGGGLVVLRVLVGGGVW